MPPPLTSENSVGSSPAGVGEDITIRFARDPLPEEDTDVLRVQLGLEKQINMLKEVRPERVEDIRRYEDRWLDVNAMYIALVAKRSGILQ